MGIFVTLWAALGTLLGLGVLFLWTTYRSSERFFHCGGVAVLCALSASLLIMGYWDPLVWDLLLAYLVFGLMGWLSERAPVRVIRWLLVICAAVCVPWHESATYIPGLGMIGISRVYGVLLDMAAIFLTVAAVRSSQQPEGIITGTFLGLWSLLFYFFSKTAFGGVWSWDYELLEGIAAAHVGGLATFLVFNSAPALVGLGGSGALGLAGGLAVCLCYLRAPILLIGLLSLPYLQLILPKCGIGYWQKRGICATTIVPLFSFGNTAIAGGVLQVLDRLPPLS